MTVKIRASIRKSTEALERRHFRPWFIHVKVSGWPKHYGVAPFIMTWEPTHPEALQTAYKFMKELDAQLMAEVHASRSSRHTTKNERLKAETNA